MQLRFKIHIAKQVRIQYNQAHFFFTMTIVQSYFSSFGLL